MAKLTNGTNVYEDAEMAECDGEKVVTMMDVLQEQEDFEEDANAVLGASDDKDCTFSKGYIKRQAIYACMTCCVDAKSDPTKRAGVCLACSLTCHENHELIELYTKRNFRCDCGNRKFNSPPCQFTPDKTDLNVDNIYNQNFSGVYCVCHRPYPDPESDTQGDMIQCIICEDWLHSNHLDAVVPSNDQYSEMICKACMDKNQFLHDYSDLAVNKENVDIDILNTSSEVNSTENSNTEVVEYNILNCNSDHIINKQADAVIEKVADDDETISKHQSEADPESINEQDNKQIPDNLPDSKKDDQSSTQTSESGVTASNEQNFIENKELLQADLTDVKAMEIENDKEYNDKNTETEHKNGRQTEGMNVSAETIVETGDNKDKIQISPKEGEPAFTTKTEKPDNRSQEQVDEDLLLADPMETVSEQKKDTDFAPSNTIQSNTDDVTKQSVSEAMDISEPIIEDQGEKDKDDLQNGSNSDSATITEQPEKAATAVEAENTAPAEHSKDVLTAEKTENSTTAEQTGNATTAEQTENENTADQIPASASTEVLNVVPVTEQSESERSEIVANSEQSENTSTEQTEPPEQSVTNAEQTETAPSTEQSEDVAITEKSENVSSKELNSVPTIEQSENVEEQLKQKDTATNEKDASADVPMDENNTDVVQNNVIEKDKSNDVTDENNTDKAKSNDIPNNKIENCTNSDKEPVNTIETDILKRKHSTDSDTESVEVKKPKLAERKCVRPKGVKKVYHGATFWPGNFRHKLCTCNECISMYKDLSVLFLTDPEDTVTAYETLGKDKTDGKPASQYEKGMAALSSLGRVQQINALTEYTKLRDKLLEYLRTFKDKKVVVKEEDIKAFFAGMKPVREPDGVYFCR